VIDRATVLGRRACAALAACSAVLHGFSLAHTTSVAATALTVVMLAACLSCAHDLWTRGTLRAWVLVALMNLAMVATHAPASAGHHHSGGGGGVVGAAPVHHSTVMTVATTLAVVEVVIAAAVLYYRTRAVRPTSLTVDFVKGMSGSPVFGFWNNGPFVVGVASAGASGLGNYNAIAGGNNLTRLVNKARADFP
jgi:hypothetical protein